jgi:hypothetical protein
METSLLDSIIELTAEPIKAVVIGKSGIVPVSDQKRPLTFDEARGYLEQLPYINVGSIGFDNFGYEMPSLAVYTNNFVVFVVEFEGGQGLYKVRRNPSNDEPEQVIY